MEIISPLEVPEEEPDLAKKMSALDDVDGHHDTAEHPGAAPATAGVPFHPAHRSNHEVVVVAGGVSIDAYINSATESKNNSNSNIYNGGIDVGSGADISLNDSSRVDSMVGGGGAATAAAAAAAAKNRDDRNSMTSLARNSAGNSRNSLSSLLDQTTPQMSARDRGSTDISPVRSSLLMNSAKSFKMPKVSFIPPTSAHKEKAVVHKKQTLEQRIKKLEKLEKMYSAYVSTRLSQDHSNNAMELLEVISRTGPTLIITNITLLLPPYHY